MRPASGLSSLTNRIFLGAALLVVLAIAAAILRVTVTVTSQSERELRRELNEAGAVVDEYRTTLFGHFLREGRLLADLPRLKAAVATLDPATVRNPADEYRAQIDSDVLIVTGPRGELLAASSADGAVTVDGDAAAMIASAREGERTWFWPQAGSVLQMASLPVWIDPGAPELLGTLSVGFRLDARAAERVRALTNTEVAFAHHGRILASTVPADSAPLEDALRDGRDTITIGDDDYLLLSRPLHHAAAGAPDANAPQAVLLRSRADLERLLDRVLTDLATTALVAVLAATLLAYGIARTVTRPLRALTETMGEMAETGDLTRRAPARGRWDDEDARMLGSTFDSLTSSIDRFQREASQRERLASLGRLSTVIAHEIRNPLMVMVGALHSLREPNVAPAEVTSAANDIEGEVRRLNRIVTDVLDFARPIRFDLAPAHISDICREAAGAVTTEGRRAIALRLDESLPAMVTDHERLRLTLVNVLSNAQDAGGSEITLMTDSAGGQARIRVRDNGPGISAEALPRIFDPYFTTKRAGTGIGLAMAKNIVEGLGGRIGAANTQGGGAEVTIVLPAAPPEGSGERLRGL